MHTHTEIVLPPVSDVNAAVTQILAPFDENSDDSRHAWWDYWKIGGRWSGVKAVAALDQERIDAFYKTLSEKHVTVSSLTFGKQTLSPAEQGPMVDALWKEAFPEWRYGGCPLFDTFPVGTTDIMRLGDTPPTLTCERIIIAGLDYKDEALEAKFMIEQKIWNGVSYIKTVWNGVLSSALEMSAEHFKVYRDEYAAKFTPAPDWLVVTIDSHS